MVLSAPSRHKELKVLCLPFNGHFSGLSNRPHYAQVVQLLRHARLRKNDLGLFLELLMLTGFAQESELRRRTSPPSQPSYVARSEGG